MQSLGFALAFLTVPMVLCGDSEGTWCYDSQDPKCGSIWSPGPQWLAGHQTECVCPPACMSRAVACCWCDLQSCHVCQAVHISGNSGHCQCGPTHWKEMAPACGGPAQSPINIDLHLVQQDPALGPFIFQGYHSAPPGPWTLENDGHTVLLRMDTDPQSRLEIRGAGLPLPAYRALQLHFHWGGPGRAGSEHSVDGQRYPMEMHVVHMNTRYQSVEEARSHPDGLAVLAVLLAERDTDNANFSALVSGLKNVSESGVSANLAPTFPLASLLPGASGLSRYYRYSGSLTTPGCQPAVLWTLFADAVPIGRAQVAQFQTVPRAGLPGSRPAPLTDNFRPQQPLGGRRVSASPGASIRAAASAPAPHLAPVRGALLGLGLRLWLWRSP